MAYAERAIANYRAIMRAEVADNTTTTTTKATVTGD